MALVRFPGTSPAPDPERDDLIELTDADELDASGKMSFLEHLDELRKRLIISLVAVVVGFVVSFIFLERVFKFVMLPLTRMLPEGSAFISTQPTEYFFLYLKVGAITGLFLALPVVASQAWLFIAPGLYAREKKFAIPFVFFSSLFFFGGAVFSHYVAFPWTWKFFIDFQGELVRFMPSVGPAFSLYVKMLLGFGLIFQMPIVVFALAKMGLVTAGFLIRNTKYAVLIIFILGAVLSPGGDVVSQALMAGPMLILYGVSICVAWLFGKKDPKDALS
jgi:sec-independent protein translocase protein TatC